MWTAFAPLNPQPAAAVLVAYLLAEAGAPQPPVAVLWATQGVTLLVAIATGWFALRSKKTEVNDSRQARFDKRLDAELDDQRALVQHWTDLWAEEHRKVLRYETWLIRHGIDLETGRRETSDA